MHKNLPQPKFGKGLIVPAVVAGLTLSYLTQALKIGPVLNAVGSPEPAFAPILLAVATLIALVPIVIREVFGHHVAGDAAKVPSLINPALFILASLLFILAFSTLGFFVATLLYSYAIISIFRFGNGSSLRGQIYRVTASVSIAVVVYLFFRVLFKVRFPEFMEGF